MSIIASFNGRTTNLDELFIPATDRAFMFADAIYEVMRVYAGTIFLFEEHLARLASSLRAVDMEVTVKVASAIMENVQRNETKEGMVYVQISRGAAMRNHSFHNLSLAPNVLIYTKSFAEHPAQCDQEAGISAVTHEDLRWARCDIKTTNLLANCLAQTKAQRSGAAEAILFRGDVLTEGTSSNVFMVKNGTYLTPPLSHFILPGTRRQFLLDRLKAKGCKVQERAIEKHELFSADEIFITSTVKEVVPVIALDNQPVGKGVVGDHAGFALGLIKDAIPR